MSTVPHNHSQFETMSTVFHNMLSLYVEGLLVPLPTPRYLKTFSSMLNLMMHHSTTTTTTTTTTMQKRMHTMILKAIMCPGLMFTTKMKT